MNEMENIRLKLVINSIASIELILKDIKTLNMFEASQMYNMVLEGFESLQEKECLVEKIL